MADDELVFAKWHQTLVAFLMRTLLRVILSGLLPFLADVSLAEGPSVVIGLNSTLHSKLEKLPGPAAVNEMILKAGIAPNKEGVEMLKKVSKHAEASPEQRAVVNLLLWQTLKRAKLIEDAAGALAAAEKVYDGHPEPLAFAWVIVAGFAAEGKRHDEAVSAWRKAVEVKGLPDSPLVMILMGLGDSLMAQGNAKEAVAAFTKLEETNGTPNEVKVSAYLKRALSFKSLGDTAAAFRDYSRVANWIERPDEERAGAFLGMCSARLEEGDFVKAVSDAGAVIDSLPLASSEQRLLALYCRAVALTGASKLEEATADCEAIKSDTKATSRNRAQALLQLAEISARKRDATRAIRFANEVLAMTDVPRDLLAEAQLRRGMARAALLETDAAVTDIDAGLAMPECQEYWRFKGIMDRGTLRMNSGRLEDAVEDLTKATQIRGVPVADMGKAWLKLGNAQEKLGHIEEMAHALQRCVEINSSLENVLTVVPYRAMVLARAGRHTEAIADFTRVLELKDVPESKRVAALGLRSVSYLETGEKEKGIADLGSAIESSAAPAGVVPKMLFKRAELYDELGRGDDADADRKRARLLNEKLLKR